MKLPYRQHYEFEWDDAKNRQNLLKHKIAFEEAIQVFSDRDALVFIDIKHSNLKETRYFAVGKIGIQTCTVRFTYRNKRIRVFGAGYWRKERKFYEKQQINDQV